MGKRKHKEDVNEDTTTAETPPQASSSQDAHAVPREELGDARRGEQTRSSPHSQDEEGPIAAPAVAAADGDNSQEQDGGHDDDDQPPLPDKEEEPPLPDEDQPPLPDEEQPPLPDEKQDADGDDGWEAIFDHTAQAFYFYNRLTGVSTWENPRVSTDGQSQPVNNTNGEIAPGTSTDTTGVAGGYNPAIHGDYDPEADYAQVDNPDDDHNSSYVEGVLPADAYANFGTFNRFTGKFQDTATYNPERHSDSAKSHRQMNAYFDVDAAAARHAGRSLKAERQAQKLSKEDVARFKKKRREKKEEKRRAWLRD